jgi:hypothetical protein
MRNIWRSRISLLLVAAFLVGGLAGAPAALAQATDDPSSAQYDPPVSSDEGTAGSAASGGSGSGLDSNIGSLPFTGMDLLIVLGVALLLTGTGFALRRLSMPPGPRA